MITVKQLKVILDSLPDNATLVSIEGKHSGLIVVSGDRAKVGWIETGSVDNFKPIEYSDHELEEFQK